MAKESIDVAIECIKPSKWDIRRIPDTQEEHQALKQSLHEDGLIYPISVARMQNKDLIIVAGRRRLRAAKELGWKKINVLIEFDDVTETQLRKITYKENVLRKGLEDFERGYGILGVFEAEGYTAEQTIRGVKSIDNWFHDHTHNKTDWVAFRTFHKSFMESGSKGRPRNSELRYDPKFYNICQENDLSPKFQYQLLQIVIQLNPEILKEAQKAGLSTEKKLLLTHTRIRDHPKIQSNIISKISDKNQKDARVVVDQTIQDLETGYLKKDGTSYTYSGEERDVIKSKPVTEKNEASYLKLMGACKNMTFLLTGKRLAKGHKGRYTKETVENNREHRYKIVKSFDGDIRQLNSLHDSLELVERATKDMLEIIDSELDVAVQKKEMNRA